MPQSVSFNYDNLFKIERVRNAFPLIPVSYSALASYLECPWCMTVQKKKRRPKEPAHFTNTRQPMLFGNGQPDPRMVGTLLHALVNLLHDTNGPISKEERELLQTDREQLLRFIRRDMLTALQNVGKVKLAMFFNELSASRQSLTTHVIEPMLLYQKELINTDSVVFCTSERFQFKLLSTSNTFADHPDWGGYVGIVGEFDQIRIRKSKGSHATDTIPVIVEFKKGLGGKKPPAPSLFADLEEPQESNEAPQPTISHAMQLMIYWMAFQTRWDIRERMRNARGILTELQMPLQQKIELMLYNLNDGCKYQLCPTNHKEALLALIECIFHLNWAMKSGYALQTPDHECRRNQLTAVPDHALQVVVGTHKLYAKDCYLLAKEAFERFQKTVRWVRYP